MDSDGQEGLDDEEGHERDEDSRSQRLGDVLLELIDLCKGNIGTPGVDTRHSTHSEPIKYEADSVKPAKSVHILEDEGKGVPSGLAEEGVGEGDLDVSVLGDELDALLKEPQAVGRVAKHASDARISFGSLDLPTIVFEEEADELADSDKGGAKRNRAHMVSEDPPYTTTDGSLAASVTVNFEVPYAS